MQVQEEHVSGDERQMVISTGGHQNYTLFKVDTNIEGGIGQSTCADTITFLSKPDCFLLIVSTLMINSINDDEKIYGYI